MGRCSALRVFGWCFPTLHTGSIARSANAAAVPQPSQQQSPAQRDARTSAEIGAGTGAFGQGVNKNVVVIVATRNASAVGPLPEVATVTGPLPSFTGAEPHPVLLRSISVGGHTREGSFAYASANYTGSAAQAPPAAPLLTFEASPRAGTARPASHASSMGVLPLALLTGRLTADSGAVGAASEQLVAPVTEHALLDAINALDGLTTADLTVDVSATAATALVWPEGQLSRAASAAEPQPQQPSSAAVTNREAPDGAREAAAVAAPAPSSATQRAVLNLSQACECVQDLRVLHIRPGAALLVGKATTSGQRIVARFERGQPASLLAPQLLAALQEGRWRHHDNVVSILAVHAVVLPAGVLDAPAAAAEPSALRGSAATETPGRSSVAAWVAAGGGSGDGDVGGFLEQTDKDLATATRALRQAEAVRGARTAGSGLIGSALPSGSNPTASGRLLTALGGPLVRLRDVVGHLRAGGGSGGGGTTAALVGRHAAASGAPPLAEAATDVTFVTLSVMEFCEGGNLSDEARRGTFKCCMTDPPLGGISISSKHGCIGGRRRDPLRCFGDAQLLRRLERFLATAREIALGLHFLHTVGLVAHGDLVGRNVLLQRRPLGDARVGCSDCVAKIAGYGRLAAAPSPPVLDADGVSGCGSEPRALSAPPSEVVLTVTPHLSATSLSRVNTVHVGLWRDVQSLAPERLRDPGAPPSFEADVYAYGVLLYEMAVGESPWASMLPACVAVGVVTDELRVRWPPPGSAGAPALPGIAVLIERCTAPAPAERPSVGEVLAELQALQQELRNGRERAEALRQQRRSERLMRTFLDSLSSSSTLSRPLSASRRSGSSWSCTSRGRGGGGGGEPLVEVLAR